MFHRFGNRPTEWGTLAWHPRIRHEGESAGRAMGKPRIRCGNSSWQYNVTDGSLHSNVRSCAVVMKRGNRVALPQAERHVEPLCVLPPRSRRQFIPRRESPAEKTLIKPARSGHSLVGGNDALRITLSFLIMAGSIAACGCTGHGGEGGIDGGVGSG